MPNKASDDLTKAIARHMRLDTADGSPPASEFVLVGLVTDW